MLILNRRDVDELLDIDVLIDALAVAMDDFSAGRASVPPRTFAMADDGAFLASMPAYLQSVGVAVQDAAAAQLVLEAARRKGVGTDVEF